MKVTFNQPVNIPQNLHPVQNSPCFTSKTEEFVCSPELMQYKRAEKYAKRQILKHSYVDLDSANLKKLEGIQYGIDVFKGLSIKQIHLLYKYLCAVVVHRGCSNGCVHCFLDAKPVNAKSGKDTLYTMSWEDFDSVIKGFKTLDERLGHSGARRSTMNHTILAPFMDSDSMEIILKDKAGNEHDIIDISKSFEQISRKTLFDTSGWNPKSKRMQERAEKYVDYINANRENFCVNLSLNPFHKIYSKYVENIKTNPELAKKFREMYINRMANAFYTFAPVMDFKETYVINRAARDNSMCDENYQRMSHLKLIEDIKAKLIVMLKENNIPESLADKYLELYDKKTGYIDTERLMAMGRMRKLFSETDKYIYDMDEILFENRNNPSDMFNRSYKGLLIDSNGKIFFFDNNDIVETDICLNFANKGKTTPKLATMDGKVFTSEELLKGLEGTKKKLVARFWKLILRK